MQLYLAPMEGLTGHVFRLSYSNHFRDFDRYFTPFIATNDRLNFKTKKEIDPAENAHLELIPQLMTNHVDDTVALCRDLNSYGYNHININLGCPSGTVVSKKRGSGFLSVPEELESFLDVLFTKLDFKISVKTRIGVNDKSEWPRLVELYSKFPLSEIIVHPRLRLDQYNGTPDIDAFQYAYDRLKCPLVYNGDIYSAEDYTRLIGRFPKLHAVMIGRGILRNPFLLENIMLTGSNPITSTRSANFDFDLKRLSSFLHELEERYAKEMPSEKALLYRMKETWLYLANSFDDTAKITKEIKKCQTMRDYHLLMLTLSITG